MQLNTCYVRYGRVYPTEASSISKDKAIPGLVCKEIDKFRTYELIFPFLRLSRATCWS